MRHRFISAFAALAGLVLSFSPVSAMGPKRYRDGETQRGLAAWYGSEQQGHLTADGETFDMHQLTAAHRQLPFGTIVRVTNLANGKQIEVRITDRGPFVNNRVIDLSLAAARAIDMVGPGTAHVRLERQQQQIVEPLLLLAPGEIVGADALGHHHHADIRDGTELGREIGEQRRVVLEAERAGIEQHALADA